MNKDKNKLVIEMGLFSLITILLLGLVTIKEIKPTIYLQQIDTKLQKYIEKNYANNLSEFNIGKTSFKNNEYIKKITSRENNSLYFLVKYKNKKISSTYQKDYSEGATLINKAETKLNKDLTNKLKTVKSDELLTISYNTKLNNCTKIIQEQLLKENFNIPLYTINIEKTILFSTQTINQELINLDNLITNLNFKPKNYNITFTNQTNITETINFTIDSAIIKTSSNIISDAIINNDQATLTKYNIVVKKLN